MSHLLVEGGAPALARSGADVSERHDNRAVSLPYRPDIDGLRGVAVFLVIAFHFGVWPFTGGYIGVDIFFVISGFLITSLLCQATTMLPALDDFYRRRIIRLMPMFLVVAVVAAVAVAFLFTPDDFTNYFQSITQVLVFRANQHFDHVTHDYFSQDAHLLPLLHTWSLSIEWQFYLMFPALFLIARKYCSPRVVGFGLAGLTLLFFVVSCVKTGSTQRSYFLGEARYFEPLLGCAAAFVRIRMRESLRHAAAIAGIILLVALSVYYGSATAFPGLHAGIVCLVAAAVVIWGEGNPVLGFRPLVHLGRISYSAYLWHWPPLAFLAYMQVPLSISAACALFVAVLILAHLSYVFVERPSKALSSRPLWRLAVLFIVLPLVVTDSLKEISDRNDGFYQRLGVESIFIHRALAPYLDRNNCLYFRRNEGQECHIGNPKSDASFYLIGDSHAGHYRWFVDVLAKDAGVGGISFTRVQCLMVPGTSTFFNDDKCRRGTQAIYEKIADAHPKYVVIGEHWLSYPTEDLSKLEGVVGALLRQNITPIILGSIAENGKNLRSCFYRHVGLRRPYEGDCKFSADNEFEKDRRDGVQRFFDRLKAKYPAVIVVDVQAIECPSGSCDAQIDGVPIYEDENHINGYASVRLAQQYLSRFGNPLRR